MSPAQRAAAEQHLVGLAAHHDAKALAVLGRRIFEVIAPDLAEAFEGKALADAEALALRRTTFTMGEDDEGTCHGRFRIPALHGHLLRTMLQAIANPARDAVGVEEVEQRHPAPVRDGLALCELLERIPTAALPRHGGCPVTVVVTMTLDQLLTGLGAAGLSTGGHISAGEARRLACRAGIIPAVLDGRSRVLDVGRRRRFHTEAQRIALTIEQRGCTAAGCELPPAMCHAHHDQAWAAGGATSVRNGRLLCGHHHRRMHDPRFAFTHHPDGQVSFHRRT